MWGRSGRKSTPGGYTDNVYRSRQSKGIEAKSRCCCFYFTRSVLILFLLILLLGAGGMSAVSIIFGYSQRWLYNVNRNGSAAYSIRCGWLYFSDNLAFQDRTSLRALAKGAYILGLVAMVTNSVSVVLAALFALRALCGRVGRGFICCAIPFSILLIGAMGAYYIVLALEVWKWEDRQIGTSRVAWPDWAWGLGAGAALAWFLAAGVASVLPQRHKYLDVDQDFEASRASPVPVAPSYAQQPSPREPYPSPSHEPPQPAAVAPPLAAQERSPAAGKKSFMPSWSRRAGASAEQPVDAYAGASDAPPGSYRSRADEIANRYRRDRSGGGSLEMAPTAPAVPKSAW